MARPLGEDEREVLHDVSWEAFERFLEDKGDGVPRVTYLDGVLELLTPSRGHERQAGWVARLIEVYAEERGFDLSAYGGWTLKDKLKRAGCEPDECYVLGDDSADEKKRPDLALESQWSRSAINKLEVYRRLGVREVWLVRDDIVTMYLLVDDQYTKVAHSIAFPDLDVAELCSFLERPTMMSAIRAFRAHLQHK